MIGVIEWCAVALAFEHLPDGEVTVGFEVCVKHVGAAREGARCTVDTRLREVVDGRKLRFDVEVKRGRADDRRGHARAARHRPRRLRRVTLPTIAPMIDREQVLHVARLARLRLSEEEVDRMAGEMSTILGHIETMNELDLDGVEPTSHVVELQNVLREDVPRPCLPARRRSSRRPTSADGGFRVPSPGARVTRPSPHDCDAAGRAHSSRGRVGARGVRLLARARRRRTTSARICGWRTRPRPTSASCRPWR